MAYEVLHLNSPAALRAHHAAWDDLWRRAEVTIPTAQAELLAQWLEQFARGARFEALVVTEGERWLAALPLVARRWRGMLSVGALASNGWTPAADLLLDPAADDGALEALARGVQRGAWSLLWLDFAIVDAPRWRRWLAACDAVGLAYDARPHFTLPVVAIDGDWDAYRRGWSRNHRQNMSRALRKLAESHGEVALRREFPTAPADIAADLRRGFEIEDRSWKGAAGSSVLRTPGLFPYYAQQAALLAERGQLEIAFLDVGGESVAFLYGWRAKGVLHAFKAGYDERFAAYSPGQLLIHEWLRDAFARGEDHLFDCVGPVTDATARWQTGHYTAGRIALAPRGWLSQATLLALKHVAPTLRRWRAAARGGRALPPTANAPAEKNPAENATPPAGPPLRVVGAEHDSPMPV